MKVQMMSATIEVKPERVQNLIISALEGGYSPWLHEATLRSSEHFDANSEMVWYGQEHMFDGAFAFDVKYDREQDEEGSGNGHKQINRDDVIAGIAVFAKEAPHQFGQWIEENDDALVADAFMQCLIFGKLVYA